MNAYLSTLLVLFALGLAADLTRATPHVITIGERTVRTRVVLRVLLLVWTAALLFGPDIAAAHVVQAPALSARAF